MTYLLSGVMWFCSVWHSSHPHTSVWLLWCVWIWHHIEFRYYILGMLVPLSGDPVDCFELTSVFTMNIGAFQFFKLSAQLFLLYLLRGCVRLCLHASSIPLCLWICLLQNDYLRDVSAMKLHIEGSHYLARRLLCLIYQSPRTILVWNIWSHDLITLSRRWYN